MRYVPSGLCVVVLVVASCGSPRPSPLADAGGAVDAATGDGAPPDLRLDLLAGDINGGGNVDGTGAAARFLRPAGVKVDLAGNAYVTDSSNHTIRKVTPAGVVTTLAGAAGLIGSADGAGAAARFFFPIGMAIDSAGNLYVADSSNQTIRKVTPAGVVTTLAGTAGMSGDTDGTGPDARFRNPTDVALDGAGNLYVADNDNQTIRKITPAGVVTTLAGTAGMSGDTDGTGPDARFRSPSGVAVDPTGNVYVTDEEDDTIRKITPGGAVTTLAGTAEMSGSADGTGPDARFDTPTGVEVDGTGNLYVTDSGNSTLRKVTPDGAVTTVAGMAGTSGSADGTGPAARFSSPFDVAVDVAGTLYVADGANDTLRKVTSAGSVTTLAGTAPKSGSADGTGPDARFDHPEGVAVDGAGNVYVADTSNNTVRKVTPDGAVTTLAGTAGMSGSADGTGPAARFDHPNDLAVDRAGNVYVVEVSTVRKITPDGVVTTLAGTAGTFGGDDGTGPAARFNGPSGVAVDGAGNVYVADTSSHTIRKITPDGVVTTLAGTAGVSGSADGAGPAARFDTPIGVAVDRAGNLYVADTFNETIRKVTPDGAVTTLAGTAEIVGSADGTGSAASFNNPFGVAIDGAGNLYVAESLNKTIRKVTPDGLTTTVAGTVGKSGVLLGASPRFELPRYVAVTGDSLVISDANAVLLLRHGAR